MSGQLERYLRAVAVQLHELSCDEREDQIEEIRVHIEAYVDQHKSAGKSDAEAEQAAMAQFGDAAKVGRDIMRARTRYGLRAIAFAALLTLSITFALSTLNRGVPSHPFGQSLAFWIIVATGQTLSMGMFCGLAIRKLAVRWIGWFYTVMLTPIMLFDLFPPHGVFSHPLGVTTHSSLQLATIDLVAAGARIGFVYAGALIGAKMAGRLLNKARISTAG